MLTHHRSVYLIDDRLVSRKNFPGFEATETSQMVPVSHNTELAFNGYFDGVGGSTDSKKASTEYVLVLCYHHQSSHMSCSFASDTMWCPSSYRTGIYADGPADALLDLSEIRTPRSSKPDSFGT
jgi:hypothetical protein